MLEFAIMLLKQAIVQQVHTLVLEGILDEVRWTLA